MRLSVVRYWFVFAAVFVLISALTLPAAHAREELDVVPAVDLERYSGLWYEIASMPNFFQRECVGTTAYYEFRDDGRLHILNSCRKEGLDSPVDSTTGVGRVKCEETFAKLRVRFFWPLSVDYYILALDDEYEYAMVGHPSRKYLWIIAREPELDEETYRRLVDLAEAKGFDVSELERTPQRPLESREVAQVTSFPS